MSTDNPQGPGRDEPSWDAPPPSDPIDPGFGSTPPPPPPGDHFNNEPPAPSAGNGKLIAYIVIGVLITICCCPAGTVFGIAAIALAAVALSKKGNGDITGAQKLEKYALIALIVGAIVGILYALTVGAAGIQEFIDEFEKATSTTTSF